ncbi:MAG: hypothetical protein EU539_09105 [Promethearchaeota archaeon]|nr:MAG: hypothetical protein EU539_09105 [Candidatus Lokiarchaeota archaeon]
MKFEDKKIFFILSPHINYYHSYRGDSRGLGGFGSDIKIMREILDIVDEIEDMGYSFGNMRFTWDYADTFWSIQLQKEYQQDVLDRIIERCKKGKDEVLIGSFGNVAQPVLDTEEFIRDHEWFLENAMGIGVKQLFPGRIAPYARTQETMFTQGMIEMYNKIGVEGFCGYYSVYPFDIGRPFLNPRLTPNQRYGLINFKSSVSDASMLYIPTYAFGDVVDYFSIKRWFKLIRKMQEKDEISGHALLFFNFDMDVDLWLPQKLPNFLKWMPKTRGLYEYAEAVDELDYVEFANLLDTIPELEVHGETTLYPDAADGYNNGFYNWAQKYDNTKLWTVGQRARWFKCISDTLISQEFVKDKIKKINEFIRDEDVQSESYLKNKCLLASTTNFGLSVPFMHPTRIKTGMSYALKAHEAAEKAATLAIEETIKGMADYVSADNYVLTACPVTSRGISPQEKIPIKSPILIRTLVPQAISDEIIKKNKKLTLNKLNHGIYEIESNSNLRLETFIPHDLFTTKKMLLSELTSEISENKSIKTDSNIKATSQFIQNELIRLDLNENGEIVSLNFDGKNLACSKFLESAVRFGEKGKAKLLSPKHHEIEVLRSGADGFSASIKMIGDFEILRGNTVHSEKIITVYSGIPALFVAVKMRLCDIKGESTVEDGSAFVTEKYDERWQEVIPSEIKPNIIGNEEPLRIWKKNFFGRVSYFDLDMREVDPRNADIDCLVANISDGWMAISDKKIGMLVGFNSLKSANFAFSPIKIRDKGFGDGYKKGQQVRINPFGNYFGELLRYWTEGSGHAYKFTKKFFTHQVQPTAPTYSGKDLEYELIIAPYTGDAPPEKIQSLADHFSFPPLVMIGKKSDLAMINNYSNLIDLAEKIKSELNIGDLMRTSYLEWVRKVNKDFDPSAEQKPQGSLNLSIRDILMLLIDGIRGR